MIRNVVAAKNITRVTELDIIFLMEETRESYEFVKLELQLLGAKIVL